MIDFWHSRWLPSDMKLANQEVMDRHQDWFARTRINVITWYPLRIHHLVCSCILAAITWGDIPSWVSAAYLLGGAAHILFAVNIAKQKNQSLDCINKNLLKRLSLQAIKSSIIWAAMLGSAIAMAGNIHPAALTALTIYVVLMTGLAYFSIPFIGLASTILVMLGAAFGFASVGSTDALLALTVVALLTHTLYSISFNLYYMFATRRLRTRTLRETNEIVQLLLNDYDQQSSDWLWQVNTMGRVVNPSERFAQAAGQSVLTLETLSIYDLVVPGPELGQLKAAAQSMRAFRNVIVPIEIGADTHWWAVSGKPIYGEDGEFSGYRGFSADVTATKQAEEKVIYMAHYDLLTHLPNRTLFRSSLQSALSRRRGNTSVAIMYVDLDHFKTVNDTMGHAVGDKVLAMAARRIDERIGVKDLVARFGGDEFAVILTHVENQDDALLVAQSVVDALGEEMLVDKQPISLGGSVGITFAPGDADTMDALLQRADLALYDAKSQGRGRYSVFNAQMQDHMLERRMMAADLRQALSKGEFTLNYQPLISIPDGEIQGYEALLRWKHPERGQVSPVDFISIAEECGLIVPIGEWVLRTAIEELTHWPEHLTIAINLSPVQMRSENLLPTLINILASTGIDPSRVELEITESVLLHDSDENVTKLHQIRDLGVKIALDDFGTGYSSLNYLRSFPFDKIKIDRSFVAGLQDRADCKAIVNAVIGLAVDLNMTTTAEGVESQEQLDALRRNGCSQAQGYLLSKAVPAKELGYGAVKAGAATNTSPFPKNGKISFDESIQNRQQRRNG